MKSLNFEVAVKLVTDFLLPFSVSISGLDSLMPFFVFGIRTRPDDVPLR
jgi:hypothetical protein